MLGDAGHYLYGVRKAGIPLWRNHIIVEARGHGQVEEAVVAEVDKNWRPKPGTYRTVKVDTLCVGYGFVPSVELTRLAECEHRYEPLLGGWIPVRNDHMETTVPDVYAVGDCTGIAGSLVAIEEGRIAGLAAARRLGYLTPMEARKRMAPSRERLAGLKRLRQVLDRISVPRPGLYELAKDDTIVCRCEEITLGEVKAALADGRNGHEGSQTHDPHGHGELPGPDVRTGHAGDHRAGKGALSGPHWLSESKTAREAHPARRSRRTLGTQSTSLKG